jgi:hypothetical protein
MDDLQQQLAKVAEEVAEQVTPPGAAAARDRGRVRRLRRRLAGAAMVALLGGSLAVWGHLDTSRQQGVLGDTPKNPPATSMPTRAGGGPVCGSTPIGPSTPSVVIAEGVSLGELRGQRWKAIAYQLPNHYIFFSGGCQQVSPPLKGLASLGFGDFVKGTNGFYVKIRGRYVPTRADGIVTAGAALVRLEMNGRAPINVQPVAAFGLKFYAVTIPPPDALKLRAIALYDRHGKLIVRVPRDQGSRWW